MRHLKWVALGLLVLGPGARAFAQQSDTVAMGRCTMTDSIAVIGNHRVNDADVRASSGLVAGMVGNAKTAQDAVRNLFQTGQFDDVRVDCTVLKGGQRAIWQITVNERPILELVRITGTNRLSEKTVNDLIDITPGRPLQAGDVVRSVTRIDSAYQNAGYYLAKVTVDSSTTAARTTLIFRITEGHRFAISGIRLHGNHVLSDKDIVHAMSTKPEAFPWWRKGEFDEDKFAADLAEKLPDIYARLGYVDFQVVKDTVIIDHSRGKALLDITVSEGKQYKVGTFDVEGNHHFSIQDINRFYPFGPNPATLTERAADALLGRRRTPVGVFDRAKWDDATSKLRTAYNNEGYIYASVQPIAERVMGPDSQPRMNLQWTIVERNPATVNRIDITGNDYTTEGCIRDALVIIPGDVFSQDRLIRSYQNLGNLGYFDSPIPPPDTRPASDSGGDVDLIFHVKEKHTGNINFGASTGQGTGIGGFIGFDQPNLFGECKKGSIQWQYGRYINNLQISYTDPTIRQSRVSGTVTAYNSESRYFIGNLGQSTNLGGSLQLGWPIGRSLSARFFTSYTLESVRYSGDTNTLLGAVANTCHGCIRSAVSASIQRDTRIGMPFPAAGTLETATLDLNGGPLGGAAHYQRLIGEVRGYATIATFGQTGIGSEPVALVLGFKGRAGTVFGNTGPFFYTQAFALGGVQFGEQLRGYPEFSIGPNGYIAGTGTFNATRASFGNTFMTTTTELGVRWNSSIYSDIFFDAGNLYASPQEFDPGRLFRGAGVGVAVVTPLGPLGLDLGYGFDKTNSLGQPDPGWQVHFKLGNIF